MQWNLPSGPGTREPERLHIHTCEVGSLRRRSDEPETHKTMNALVRVRGPQPCRYFMEMDG